MSSPSNVRADFVWGVSTASYQIEGAVQEDGPGPSIWDRYCRQIGRIANGDRGDIACDHYHRHAEDIDQMRTLGISAYRFSVAWPRILPTGRGAVNVTGLAFYDRLIDALLSAKIEPWLCQFHLRLVAPHVTETKVTKEGHNVKATVRITEISPEEIHINVAWAKIQDSGDIASMREFINRFPNSLLAQNARHRIDVLERAAREAEKQAAARLASEQEAARQKEAIEQAAKVEAEKRPTQLAAEREAARQREAAEQVEQTCKREQEKLALLQSAGAKDQLRVFVKELTCERLRPIAQASLSPPAARVDDVPGDTREFIRSAQTQLRRIGCFDGDDDGVLNGATVRALKAYLARRGQPMDEPQITPTMLSKIKAETNRVCPLVCPPGKYVDGERCIAERHHEGFPERARACHEKRQDEREAKRHMQVPRSEQAAAPRPGREPARAESRPAAIPSAHAIGTGF
jgi:hypothetical protein